MAFDATLLNTQHYKVRIKGKMEQSMEKSSALPLHCGVVAIEKGAFRSPLTTVADFTLLDKNTCNCITVCKLFVLIVTWRYNCLSIIIIIN